RTVPIFETPSSVAVMVTGVGLRTRPLTSTCAVLLLAGTITCAGTVSVLVSLDVSVTAVALATGRESTTCIGAPAGRVVALLLPARVNASGPIAVRLGGP